MTFRTKIGRVTPKLATIDRQMGLKRDVIRLIAAEIDSLERYAAEEGQTFAGLAFVMWSSDGGSTSVTLADPKKNRIPNILIADFVRNRLLGSTIVNWAVGDTMAELGYKPKSID